MKKRFFSSLFLTGAIGFLPAAGLRAQTAAPAATQSAAPAPAPDPWPSAPPQDQGLPYTTSGKQRGLAAIKDYIAVCAGSRYAYVNGYKVRLDDAQLLAGDAILRDGKIYVPAAFAGILATKPGKPDPAPDYLKDRWVYTFPRETFKASNSAGEIEVDGQPYQDLAVLASGFNWKYYQSPRGFALLSNSPITFNEQDTLLADNIVTLFDTPEKLVDPALATKYIPRLKLQGAWTDHVSVTPEQLKLLDGPETKWDEIPLSAYDLTGFNAKLLGSKVPPPGVYPRLLFSPEDVPGIYARMKSQKTGQATLAAWQFLFTKTWWDPKSSDGQVFVKLASGQLDELKFADPRPGTVDPETYLFQGQTPGVYNAFVNYNTNSLTSMALYCLLTGDDAHGKQAANAIVNYFHKIEPLLDKVNAMSDSQFGTNNLIGKFSETGWRGLRDVVAHMDVGLALDFAGHWMTAAQKDFMRRIIAKATYGRCDNMQAAPARLRDGQATTWYLTDFIDASAIEGLEGCDPEVIQIGRESVRDFLDWGIDGDGTIFEGNGVNIFGLQEQILSMIILARRGDNYWGHPHWRKLLDGQAESMSPDGMAVLSSGHSGAVPFSFQAADEIKAFYPDNLAADWILSHQDYVVDPLAYNATAFQAAFGARLSRVRIPGPTYPGSAFTGLYDTDWQAVTREQAKLPVAFDDHVYGLLSAYSDNSPEATWLALHVRANQYLGAGLFHADVGMFYMSGLGVNWITSALFTKEGSGKYHNLVLIANKGEPDGIPARGDYLGSTVSAAGAFGVVDQTKSYSYEWSNLFELWDDGAASGDEPPVKWELETDPQAIAAYKGTQNDKARAWAPDYVYTNWIPVVRRPWNPVQYAFRAAGMVRGPHPYALVVDDVKKDGQSHLYQWTAIIGANVTQAKLEGAPANEVFLVQPSSLDANNAPKPASPMLLVCALPVGGKPTLQVEAMKDGPINRYNENERYNRISVNLRGTGARYRVLLIPFKMGEDLPKIDYDPKTAQATLHWPDQDDVLNFTTDNQDNRTRFAILRGGSEILRVQ